MSRSLYLTLYDDDQEDRQGDPQEIDWEAVTQRDVVRCEKLKSLLETHPPRAVEEYRCAAIVLLHSTALESLQLALQLAHTASDLESEDRGLLSLVAVAQDRLLLAQGQPQWYGTQRRWVKGRLELEPIDAEAVSDEERVRMGLPTLPELRSWLLRKERARLAKLELERRRQANSSADIRPPT